MSFCEGSATRLTDPAADTCQSSNRTLRKIGESYCPAKRGGLTVISSPKGCYSVLLKITVIISPIAFDTALFPLMYPNRFHHQPPAILNNVARMERSAIREVRCHASPVFRYAAYRLHALITIWVRVGVGWTVFSLMFISLSLDEQFTCL